MNYKVIISIVVLVLSTHVYGQEQQQINDQSESVKTYNNEIRFNLLTAVAGIPEVNYERFIDENMGLGLAVGLGLDQSLSTKAYILPYYRLYFGKKKASGFFIEGNMAVVSQKETYNTYDYYGYTVTPIMGTYTKSTTNFGFGAAIGVKLLARKGYTGEVFLGGGRLFGESIASAYPRIGICLGKRF